MTANTNSLPAPGGARKAATRGPNGASALASELGAARDVDRDVAQARSEGDKIPSSNDTSRVLEFGMPNGAEQGVETPGREKRTQLQDERNQELGRDQPDLGKIAQTSAGATFPTTETAKSTAANNPDAMLNTVARSTGTESGTSTANNGIEVTRDAPTNA
ncbi:uncharacterized protein PAN0_011c4346 [Moesziomyces antarcticus]|uniref:Uncharacterized protein n=2 Tax=Pseudozyma antarctica TaxID=84753 RepID=A0A5C3FRG7_PSEA2|nr:uncharacterized protein PAN0_011c4346 [Moesziomyces antarcticus]GAK66124.1 conserved hypothetical protein [Moesziomyces antarcticus]SPO46902.1 uncharacterized protein PSANT_04588 [Moesziomyces antarcticus]